MFRAARAPPGVDWLAGQGRGGGKNRSRALYVIYPAPDFFQFHACPSPGASRVSQACRTLRRMDERLERLEGVHPDLVRVVKRALESVDAQVLEGLRTPRRQMELFGQGRTAEELTRRAIPMKFARPAANKVTWTLRSKHLKQADGFGHAVDLWAGSWTDLGSFDAIAKAMFAAAEVEGVQIRWGADWDRDGKPRERGESDSPHFELVAP